MAAAAGIASGDGTEVASAAPSSGYAPLWAALHGRHAAEETEGQEWHVAFDVLWPVVEVAVRSACGLRAEGQDCLLIDVGCGTSALGGAILEKLPGSQLLLVDVVPELVEALRQQHAAEPRIKAAIDDCRSLASLEDGSATVVLDKGTLDAMNSPEDRQACLRSMARVLQRPHGVLVSVGFAAASRVLFLRREAEELQLQLRLRVVRVAGSAERRLVAMMSCSFGDLKDDVDDFTEAEISMLLYRGPLRSERLVFFEHAALPRRIVLEQVLQHERQLTGDDVTGNLVWPAAYAFAAHLCAQPGLVRDRRLVELGAGTGLVGLVAAALGAAEVVLTDLPDTLPLLRRNLDRNEAVAGGRARAAELRWGTTEGPGSELQNFDVVLGCEIVYSHDAEVSAALVESMSLLTARGGVCLMAYEFRGGLMEDLAFFELAAERFEVEAVSLAHYGYGIASDATADSDQWRMLYVYKPKATACHRQASSPEATA